MGGEFSDDVAWRDAREPKHRRYAGEWTLTALLNDRAERFAGEVAISAPDGSLTYDDLVERAGRVAGFLASLGVSPGDRVATMLPNGLPYVAAWHGSLFAGAIEVPINTEYKGLLLEHLLRDSGASVLVADERYLPRLAGLELPDLAHVVVAPAPTVAGEVGGHGEPGTHGVPDASHPFLHHVSDALAHDPLPQRRPDETDPTYVMYTSGTSGPSKGVLHNHRSSVHYLMPFVEGLGVADDDVCYSMFPLFHQMGRTACTTAAIWCANRVEMRPGFSAGNFWTDVTTCGATWAGYFGAVILILTQRPPSELDRAHSLLRAFGSSGRAELLPVFEERFGVTLYEVYGSTEGGLITGLGGGPRRSGTMGKACKQVEIAIVDERDDPLPPGSLGELVVRPKHPFAIFQGYWNRPEATVRAWRNLWFHTGDAGVIDAEGYFTFRDRNADVIRRRGENIASFFVEAAALAQPGVADCAAYAVPSPLGHGEEEVMLALVLAGGTAGPPAGGAGPSGDFFPSFFAGMAAVLPRHAVPRYVRVMDELPKTPTQRTKKHELRAEGVTAGAVDREALGIVLARD